jgi:hypothetical protein
MFLADLPPSIHIEDRRGEPACVVCWSMPTTTINEMIETILERRKSIELARALGINDIKNPRWLRGR